MGDADKKLVQHLQEQMQVMREQLLQKTGLQDAILKNVGIL